MNIESNKALEVSDELLNAFVDNELDAEEKSRLLNHMVEDASGQLRERVCQLWQLKELVRSAYPQQENALSPPNKRSGTNFGRYSQALAASLMLALGAALGWFANEGQGTSAGQNLAARQMTEGKVILHLASSDPGKLKAALDEAEEMSQRRDRTGSPMQVELVANEGGLTLFRADVSPYARRIETMNKTHENITFVACNNTIGTLRKAGVDVRLLPYVEITPSVVDEILRRVQHGWTYVKI
jgi:intracellular sulfur oxidation DsrE/DsrF family protein